MDREEIIGFGSAIGGHLVLAAVLIFGLFTVQNPPLKPAAIAVSLVGEEEVSTAPDAVSEAPAPSAEVQQSELESAPPPAPSPDIIVLERPVPQPVEKPVAKLTKREVPKIDPRATQKITQKTVQKPVQQTQQKQTKISKPAQSSSKAINPQKNPGFGSSFEDMINDTSKASKANGRGTATNAGTTATKTATQVKQAVNVSLKNEITPFFKRCAPSGVDVNLIYTSVTLNISATGTLVGTSNVSQRGVNESNQSQAALHRDCVLKALRAASPYQNLPADAHDVWKNWPMEFSTR